MSLVQRARDTGMCPPSLLSDERVVNDDGFETAVLNLLEPGMTGASIFYVQFYVDDSFDYSCLTIGVCCPLFLFFATGMILGTDDSVASDYKEALKVSL